MIGAVPHHMTLIDVAGSSSLTFACGDLPAEASVFSSGHEPNGYFWEGSFGTSLEVIHRM